MTHVRHRYEVVKPEVGPHRRAQLVRIRKDAAIEDMMAEESRVKDVQLKSYWKEILQDESEKRRNSAENKITAQFLREARRANVMIRRAALRKLLEDETQTYKVELNDIDKAIYTCRI